LYFVVPPPPQWLPGSASVIPKLRWSRIAHNKNDNDLLNQVFSESLGEIPIHFPEHVFLKIIFPNGSNPKIIFPKIFYPKNFPMSGVGQLRGRYAGDVSDKLCLRGMSQSSGTITMPPEIKNIKPTIWDNRFDWSLGSITRPDLYSCYRSSSRTSIQRRVHHGSGTWEKGEGASEEKIGDYRMRLWNMTHRRLMIPY